MIAVTGSSEYHFKRADGALQVKRVGENPHQNRWKEMMGDKWYTLKEEPRIVVGIGMVLYSEEFPWSEKRLYTTRVLRIINGEGGEVP